MVRSSVAKVCKRYYCYSLAEIDDSDIRDIKEFEAVTEAGYGLVRYLQEASIGDERCGLMRTYLVRDRESDELVGYFSLKAGLVSLDETGEGDDIEFDTWPGVELANFAINDRYRRKHAASRGCSNTIFRDLVLPLVRGAAQIVGICLLYIYSLPYERLINNYHSYGFSRLSEEEERMLHARLKPRYDAQCIFMYMAL